MDPELDPELDLPPELQPARRTTAVQTRGRRTPDRDSANERGYIVGGAMKTVGGKGLKVSSRGGWARHRVVNARGVLQPEAWLRGPYL